MDREEVRVFREWAICKSGCAGYDGQNGRMHATGDGRTRLLTEWLNRCEDCGGEEWLLFQSPRIVYETRK